MTVNSVPPPDSERAALLLEAMREVDAMLPNSEPIAPEIRDADDYHILIGQAPPLPPPDPDLMTRVWK